MLLVNLIIFGQQPDGPVSKDRGIYFITIDETNNKPADSVPMHKRKFNTADTFENLIIKNSVAMLVGNDNYEPGSEYQPLSQCVNDVRLLQSVLDICCNIERQNIHTFTNITADEFRAAFKKITSNLCTNQGFIFSYSGHGDKDGALVFTDGSRIMPEELKAMVNSFDNDTVMMLDACYSGNNEGPINFKPENQFKENCLRIYGSLAHLSAKEIEYGDDYFGDIQLFYENVLGLKGDKALPGNGYFSSFIGYFFAEYRVADYTKITFNDLFRFISNKSKEYVEYLALRSNENKVITTREAYSTELSLRLNQHPKMLPYDRDVKFKNPLQKNLMMRLNKPNVLALEQYAGPRVYLGIVSPGGMGPRFDYPVSPAAGIRMSITPQPLRGVFFGIESGYTFFKLNYDELMLHMIPAVGLVGFQHQFAGTKNILGIRTDIGAGIAYGYYTGPVGAGSPHKLDFTFQTNVGLVIEPFQDFMISFDVRFFGLAGTAVNGGPLNVLFFGLQFPIAVSYKF